MEHVARIGDENSCRILVENTKTKNPVARPNHKWEIHVKKVEYVGVNWIYVSQNRAGSCEHGTDILGSIRG
jgi:hypothetical protein